MRFSIVTGDCRRPDFGIWDSRLGAQTSVRHSSPAAGRDGLTVLFVSLTCEDGEDNNIISDATDFHFCI